MKRGEIYCTAEKVPERGHKPGYYVIVSRDFVAGNDDVSTVVCAPIYSEVLGLASEVVLDRDDGVPRESAIRCDFLTLMFKRRLTHFVGTLSSRRQEDLNRALAYTLQLPS